MTPRLAVVLCVAMLAVPRWVHAQAAVIDVANLAQNTITALSAIKEVANQILELTGWATFAVDTVYADDLAALGDVMKDAQALSFDLQSLHTQIQTLFDLKSVPNGSAGLRKRLASMRTGVVQAYLYALRTHTLLTTVQTTITHLHKLFDDIAVLLGNRQGNQMLAQYQALIAKQQAMLHTNMVAFQHAQSLDHLTAPITVEMLYQINISIMEDYPK